MAQQPVTKLYELRTLGFDSVHKDLQVISKDFAAIKKAKLDAEKGLAQTTKSDEQKKYREEIQKLVVAEKELRVQRQQMVNEQKAETIARQTAINQKKDEARNTKILAGSYAELLQQQRALLQLVKAAPTGSPINFQGQTLSFDAAIAKLKQLSAAEQDFRRQFSKDSLLVGEYTTGIVQAFKSMGLGDLVGGQITKASTKINELDKDFERLKQELSNVGVTGKGSLDIIEKELIDNRKEALLLKQQVSGLQQSFRGVGDIGSQITNSIARGFQAAKGQLASFALQYLGLQAIISRAQSGVQEAKLSSDLTTDLEIQLGGAAGAADKLNVALRGLNTRTTLTGLQAIADIALRAGVGANNIAEVTKAIDVVKVAFGKDFGSVEEGTETFAKLINIFFEDGEITGDRILKIGNSIRALANETVASVPFITDFSGRMAGVKQIANVTLPDILGLGAGFEEFKQSAEVSSTALVKVIPKLAQDTKKFADILGITEKQFSVLIDTNPAGALIQVAEALVKSGGDIKAINNTLSDVSLNSDQIADNLTKAAGGGVSAIAQALADSELGAGRITTILATIGGKADVFRERIARAGETMGDTGAITDAFNKKNTNLAATIDKTSKKITDAFASKNFQLILSGLYAILTALIAAIPVLLTLTGLLTIGWAAQNIALIKLRASLILNYITHGAQVIVLNLVKLATLAYNFTLFLLNGTVLLVTRGLALLNITLKASTGPLGIILAIAGLLFTAFKAFGGAMKNSTDELKAHTQQARIARDVAREAAKATSDQRAQAQLLVGVIKDLTISEDTRLASLKKLIEIDPIFSKTLKDGKINYDELNKSLAEYNENLIRNAELEASRIIQQRETQKLTDLVIKKQDIETDISTKNVNNLQEIQQISDKVIKNRSALKAGLNIAPSKSDFINAGKEVVKDLELEILRQQKIIDASQKDFNNRLKGIADTNQAAVDKLNKETPKLVPFEIDIPKLKAEIDALDKQIADFKGAQADLDKLSAERLRKQELLDKALNKDKEKTVAFKGSKLTGEQKDIFKDIEALRDRQLTNQETRFAQQIVGEEQYLKNVYAINATAIDAKLALLDGSNAEERKIIADLNLELIKLEVEKNNKIFDLKAKALKDQLDIDIKNAQEVAKRVKEDPTKSESEKAQAALDADKLILAAQIVFNAEMDKIEKDRNNISKRNAEDRARDARNAQAAINEDQKKLLLASVEDERKIGEKLMAEFKNIINTQREEILNSTKSPKKKKAALEELDKQEKEGLLARQIAALKVQLPIYQKLLDNKQISEEEYAKFYAEFVEKVRELNADLINDQNKVNITDLGSLLTNKIRSLFSFDTIDKKDDQKTINAKIALQKLFADTITQTFELAKTAMDDYYSAEQQQIQNSLDVELKRLDIEKQQQLDRAQSREEEASINAQFAAKQDAANRAAFEKNKKLQREQAKINLAIQLSNLAVIAFAPNPANIATLGIAGAIMYAIQAAIAIANYALNISRINSAKFARGGVVKEKGKVPTKTGGKVTGPSHRKGGVKFIYEAEGEELAIVNKKSAKDTKVRTITGTNKQIASMINELGGGIKFAGGARVKKFESGGFIGQSLQAPVFTPASTTIVNHNGDKIVAEKFDELIDRIDTLADQQSRRIDRIEVRQVTSTVTDAQKKAVKQSSVATL